MDSPLKRIFSGFMGVVVGCFLLWQAIDAAHRNYRLEVNPHARARVESTWTSSGRHSSRYADLSFANANGGSLCHAKGVTLGPSSVATHVGAWIDVAPIPGACGAPDAPTNRTAKWLVALQFVVAFLAFAGGGMKMAGAPLPFARFSAPRRFARL